MPFLSPWLEDWDSIQFALGIHEFSIANHQPHPPGYPLYILLARCLNLMLNNDTTTLTLLSAILNSLTIIPLYLLTKKMFDRQTAILTSIIFIFIPANWILSEIGISNIPGQFFYVLIIYFMYIKAGQIKYTPILSLLSGLILGVRLTEFPIIISLLSLIILSNFSIKLTLITTISFGLGFLIWFAPTLIMTGLSNYQAANSSTVAYLLKQANSHQYGIFIENLIFSRLVSFINLFYLGYTKYLTLFLFSLAFLSLISKNLRSKFKFKFIFVWLLSYLIPFLFLHTKYYYDLKLPQYVLPTVPPLTILAGYYLKKTLEKNLIIKIVTITTSFIVISTMINRSLEEISLRAKQAPPTIEPVLFTKKSFSPQHTTIISTFTYRQFQYYAPEFTNFNKENVNNNINSDYVILDNLKLKDEIKSLKNYQLIDQKRFQNPQLHFSRLKETNIYILKQLK